MSKATDALSLRDIHNPYSLCSRFDGCVYVDYRAEQDGGMFAPAGYRVVGVRGQDFGTVWYHHGNRVFRVPRGSQPLKERRADALAAALSFAAAQVSHQPTRWGRDPFGAWQTMDVLGRAGVKAKEVREVTPLTKGEEE